MKFKTLSRKKIISILASLLVIVIYRAFYYSPATNQNNSVMITPITSSLPINVATESAQVIRVVDGDTIELGNGQVVRYIGIDSPELHHPKIPVQCFGQEAADFNKKLVEGKTVRLEKDVSETDKYKRLLRYVWIENSKLKAQSSKLLTQNGQVMINEILVREGYAFAATFPPDVRYAEIFRQAQSEAMNNNKGLWKSCPH